MPTVLDVLFPLPLAPLRFLAPFDAPDGPPGARVAVPWQGGVRIGLVLGVASERASKALELKEAIGWLDDQPFVRPEVAALLPELAAACGAPAGVVLADLAATGFNDPLRHRVRAVAGASLLPVPADRWCNAEEFDGKALEVYRQQGLLQERVSPAPDTVRVLRAQRAADAELDGAPRANQRAALRLLERDGPFESAAALARAAGVPDSAARALVTKGYAAYAEVPAPPPPLWGSAPEARAGGPAELAQGTVGAEGARWGAGTDGLPSPGPAAAWPEAPVTVLGGGRRRERLARLLPRLQRALDAGESPLLLLPEGALLREAAELLAPHLPLLCVSGELDDATRRRCWQAAASGEPRVWVGTYLALLLPLPRPGPLVVLEAAASAYKLPAGARLFVPSVAAALARAQRRPLLLSDALPSPDMLAQAAPEARVWLPTARQRLHPSDMAGSSSWPLSSDLVRVLRQVEARGRQAILLAPRRGFSAALGCPDCGYVTPCPNCDLALRYHRARALLRCHQCGHRQDPPPRCPQCGQPELGPQRGAGTEWGANAVARMLPGVPVLRFDRDRRDDLTPLYRGEPGVVVGTTALLRQPPLPVVSLVALMLLDSYLNVSDFRAEEEALRLLLQLPELWRDRVPLTLVQTFQPQHTLLELLQRDDPGEAVREFLRGVGERRARFGYPPAVQLAKVQLSARERGAAQSAAAAARRRLEAAGAAQQELVGPTPAPVARIRGQYAYQLFIRAAEGERFRALLAEVDPHARGVRVRVDVDPRDVGEFLE